MRSILLASFFGGVIFGFNTGIISGTGGMVKEDFDLSDIYQGILTSSIVFGATFGSIFGGEMADNLGRLKAILLAGFICIVCPVAMAFMPEFWSLVIVRTLLGLAVGVISVVVPMYVSETVEKSVREKVGTVFQLSICLGILFAFACNFAFCLDSSPEDCFADKGDSAWRWQFAIGAVFGVCLCVLVLAGLQESPVWIANQRLHKSPPLNGSSAERDPLIASAAASAPSSVNDDAVSWREVFANGKDIRVGGALAASLQLTGVNTIIYYSPDIFDTAGLGDYSLIVTLSIGVWNVLTVLLAYFLVERIGRRTLFIAGLVGMASSTFLLVLGYTVFEDSVGPIAVFSLFAYIMFFECGPGSLFWGIVSDFYPPRTRARSSAFVNFLQWGFNLLLTLCFPPLLGAANGEAIAFGIFTLVGLVCIFTLMRILPRGL